MVNNLKNNLGANMFAGLYGCRYKVILTPALTQRLGCGRFPICR